MPDPVFDLAIVGGINGCGIARDAAGRGLSVLLCEQDDLANGTSSASTKLIHGGLRYLEYYEFRLVREALTEREVLLRAAPHIIWPLRFILPHRDAGLRPAWLIRLGLFIYDHLGGRVLLPGTTTVDLRIDEAGRPLKPVFTKGFEYSDCWVMDSRLVVLNAMDAAAHGADIRIRTACNTALREGEFWTLSLQDRFTGEPTTAKARVLINATGPWLDSFLTHVSHEDANEHIRMVKGSHIIVRRLFDHPRAYIFQNADGRIIFAIPYEGDFTLIGTTDVDFTGTPDHVTISPEETEYLCRAAGEYFRQQIATTDVVGSYAGIRPLFDDGKSEARAATRDYVLKLDTGRGKAPLLSIYGGKITTYRKLAESVLEKIAPFLPTMGKPWTEDAHLPGGDFAPDRFEQEALRLRDICPLLTEAHARRLFRTYGSRAMSMVEGFRIASDLGPCFGNTLYGFEVAYLMRHEWARTAEDVLRRRTNMGLFLTAEEALRLDAWMREPQNLPAAEAAIAKERQMQLELDQISKKVGRIFHIADVSLTFTAGTLNILLGPTLSGKTTLMRLMAGLDRPTTGRVLVDGRDVTGVPVQKRNVAMVYQQFINYPNLTVYENIASPLRIARQSREEIDNKVNEIAGLLKLTDMLGRTPQELSGGQQQRTALARALAKGADLVLLDEPLANLDYKLREELREELPRIFSATGAIFVYATTEPSEALLLGGNTATLHEGKVTQFGPTLEVFRKPADILTAQTFSDPPMNLMPVTKVSHALLFKNHVEIPLMDGMNGMPDADYTVGFRPNHLYLHRPTPTAISVQARVVVTEITGSESYIHVDIAGQRWIALAHGIHTLDIDETIEVFLDPAKFYVFDERKQLVATPDNHPAR